MEADGGNLYTHIVLLLLLIMANAFFSMSETAVITYNDSKLRKQAQEGNKRAVLLAGLVGEPSRFLSTIQVGITLSGLLASAVTATKFAPMLAREMSGLPLAGEVRWVLALILITLVLAVFTIVFGELVPKRIAMQRHEKIAFTVAPLLHIIFKLSRPFVSMLSLMANGALRLAGIDPNATPEPVTEEEIRMMIDAGNESGHIEESDKDMINNIFEFDDHTVDEMMTHRTEIVAVEKDAQLDQIISVVVDSGYSRIPVYEDDLDTIVGILYVKDLLGLVTTRDLPFHLENYIREPLYVPESNNCKNLLKELKEKKIQMAIVVDEYGGTSGLITMEDLLESIVGNIQDEYDDEEEDISVVAENVFRIDGLASFDKICKFFDLPVEEEDEEEYDTIGGYIMSLLGYIPAEDERPDVLTGNVRFTVEEMDERRISKLLAERRTAPAEEENRQECDAAG